MVDTNDNYRHHMCQGREIGNRFCYRCYELFLLYCFFLGGNVMSRMTPFRDEVEEQNYATAKQLKFWDKVFPFASKSLSSDKHYCVCGCPYPSCAIYWVLAGKNFTRHHANVWSIMIHQEICGQQKSDLRDNFQNDLNRVCIIFDFLVGVAHSFLFSVIPLLQQVQQLLHMLNPEIVESGERLLGAVLRNLMLGAEHIPPMKEENHRDPATFKVDIC